MIVIYVRFLRSLVTAAVFISIPEEHLAVKNGNGEDFQHYEDGLYDYVGLKHCGHFADGQKHCHDRWLHVRDQKNLNV